MNDSKSPDSPGVTQLLIRWSQGDEKALENLLPIVHRQLRRVAHRELRDERVGHTLQPTALVNELYLRLVEQRRASWQNRAHFFAVAAQMMRRILVDYARAQVAIKRGALSPRVSLVEAENVGSSPAFEVIAVDTALERLAEIDPEQARVVELRFFSGLTVEEIAHVLNRSPRTIKREWRLAKAWLHQCLGLVRKRIETGSRRYR